MTKKNSFVFCFLAGPVKYKSRGDRSFLASENLSLPAAAKMLSKIFLFALFTSMVVADLDAEENNNQPELLYGQQVARFMAFRVTKTTVKIETK